jgi:hypothetical protein
VFHEGLLVERFKHASLVGGDHHHPRILAPRFRFHVGHRACSLRQ